MSSISTRWNELFQTVEKRFETHSRNASPATLRDLSKAFGARAASLRAYNTEVLKGVPLPPLALFPTVSVRDTRPCALLPSALVVAGLESIQSRVRQLADLYDRLAHECLREANKKEAEARKRTDEADLRRNACKDVPTPPVSVVSPITARELKPGLLLRSKNAPVGTGVMVQATHVLVGLPPVWGLLDEDLNVRPLPAAPFTRGFLDRLNATYFKANGPGVFSSMHLRTSAPPAGTPATPAPHTTGPRTLAGIKGL